MKLINNFFEVTSASKTETGLECKVRFNADHSIYKVHFPGKPVTPGVCLVQMAAEILEQQYGKQLLFTSSGSIKFKQTLTPEKQPSFVYSRIVTTDDTMSVNVSVADEETQYANMSLRYNII